MQPDLTITTKKGVETIMVEFDPGDRETAFALLQKALPAIKDLDRRIRQSIERQSGNEHDGN